MFWPIGFQAKSLSTYDCSTLYTTLPHNLIKEKLLDFIERTFYKVPRRPSYGVYISQLITFARVCIHVDAFNTRNKCLSAKLLKQGYRYHKLGPELSSVAWSNGAPTDYLLLLQISSGVV